MHKATRREHDCCGGRLEKRASDAASCRRSLLSPPRPASPHHGQPLPDFRLFLGCRSFKAGDRSLPLPVKLPVQPRSCTAPNRDSRGVSRKLHESKGRSSEACARGRGGGLGLSTEDRRWRSPADHTPNCPKDLITSCRVPSSAQT